MKTAGLNREGADTEFYVQQMKSSATTGANDGSNHGAHSRGCGSGDTSQRDELLAQVREVKNIEAKLE
ncbi:MAG: hypothetical protein DME19_04355 [Verrucomicrobia bacterium]|nr:MAG: hypothetical protein DME19_04355 [Verrucomicrobiota bacterium]